MSIYSEILDLNGAGRRAVMATVTGRAGSGPRGEGAGCLIEDGRVIFGSVGGGMVEAGACRAASEVAATGFPARLYFNLNGTEAAEAGMLCGGEMSLFLERVSPAHPADLALFERLKFILRGKDPALAVTALDECGWVAGECSPRIVIERDGRVTGDLKTGGSVEAVFFRDFEGFVRSGACVVKNMTAETGAGREFFLEPVVPRPVLCIFGGGHVSRALTPVAAMVDFKVVVVDDRPEYARPEDFPRADRVLCMPFDDVMGGLDTARHTCIVIATRGHIHDMTVLMQALRTDAGYVGMIGSSRKREILFQRLLAEGFTDQDLKRVNTPIGMDIGAETPAEIAVSIVAELVLVRAGGPTRRKEG